VLSGDKILIGLSVVMLIGLPMAWRTATITRRLRQQGVVSVSPDARSIPPEAALPILAELRAALPKQTTPKLLAQSVANVFETLNARPPGLLASLALLAVHAGSFLLALVLAVVFALAQHHPRDGFGAAPW
jgi:hypothetical protein